MNRLQALALVFLGAVLILTPVVAHEIGAQFDKERMAQIMARNPGSHIAEELRPSGYEGYHWACFGVGAAIAFAGLGRFKPTEGPKAEKWPTTPEV